MTEKKLEVERPLDARSNRRFERPESELKLAYVNLASRYVDFDRDRVLTLTVNPYWSALVAAVDGSKGKSEPNAAGGILADELVSSARAGDRSAVELYASFWNKFFLRFESRLFGRTDKRSNSVRFYGCFECEGRRFISRRARNLHLHGLLVFPNAYSRADVETTFDMCWRKFVMLKRGTAVKFEPVYDFDGWAGYCVKKFGDPELASDRLYERK